MGSEKESTKDPSFLTRLEQLQFSLKNTNNGHGQPNLQADIHRSLYLHMLEGRDSHDSTDCAAYSMEAEKIKEVYANIVDNMDEEGLNNFAAGALSLCHYHKNESSKWQTHLSLGNVLGLAGFHDKSMSELDENDYSDLTIPIKKGKIITDSTVGLPSTSAKTVPSRQSDDGVSKHGFLSSCTSTPAVPSESYNKSMSRLSALPTCSDTPYKHFESKVLRLQDAVSHSSAFKSTKDERNFQKQMPGSSVSLFENQPKQATFTSNGAYEMNKWGGKESVHVESSKIGGPYANFGQKPKVQNVPNKWKYGKQAARREETEEEEESDRQTPFKTAREQLIINQQKKNGNSRDRQVTGSNYGLVKKSLGTRRGPANKFVPPVLGQDSDESDGPYPASTTKQRDKKPGGLANGPEEYEDERLKGIDPNMIELIKNDIMDQGAQITWSDIAGLEFAKKTIQEIVVWPMLRPDIFTGLRGPPKGLLLFGPPGTGKTLIGKCIASQSKSTFFSISASSLTSKWVGEGEKMVRALFAVARCSQPAVVFIDEVDSLLSQRSDSEHESSRRIKTEFLVQLDGASTASDERLLVIGATNRPQEIDEAARRRFVKRLLIPLPELVARKQIVNNLMSQQTCNLNDADLQTICERTDGYSGADMSNLCREAALGPIRSIPFELMETITPDQVRPILLEDFDQALRQVRASVSPKDLLLYSDWNKTYGSFGQ